jgi:exopolysaccharide biosynthesis polyprenyl glycosylphosphotransferase
VVGWFEQQAVLGLIAPELTPAESASVTDLEGVVRRRLIARLGPAAVEAASVQLHVHSPVRQAQVEPWSPVDPLVDSLQLDSTRSAVRDGLKRGLDLIGSLLLLGLLSPLLLLIAAMVKLKSPGPVFFRQERIGEHGKPFTMLKFRTMHVNADHAIHQRYVSQLIKAGAQGSEAGQNGVFKITDDPRVTTVGRLLRKTSLDELPQFLNVLRGDMSLVGPRPPLAYEVEQYQPWHLRRVLEAKPGITGLWQVTGRSRTTFDDMVRLDLRYARARSLWTDIRILLATPAAVISGKGAC